MKIKKIYLGQRQIRPEGWKPGENTMLYLPLKDSISDGSLYGRDVSTNSGMTKSTQKGVECYQVGSSGGISLGTSALSWIKSGGDKFTFSCWIYRPTNPTGNNRELFEFAVQSQAHTQVVVKSGTSQIRTTINSSGVDTTITTGNSDWKLFTYTIDSGTVKIYLDGVLGYTGTNGNSGWGSWNYSYQQGCVLFGPRNYTGTNEAWNGYVSNLILENKARTAQEISDYYNKTKSNYGL